MITIKLPYKTDNDLTLIKEIIREQTIIKKYSYNRFIDGKSEKDIRLLCKSLKNINNIDSWFIQSSILEGKQIFKTSDNKKVIFNKLNFIRRQKLLINKEEYKNSNKNYIYSIGEKNSNGNRKFNIDVENNRIIFKPKIHFKIWLELPKLRNNIKKQLELLDKLSKQKLLPITYKLDMKYVYISFDEIILNNYDNINNNKQIIKRKNNRILGIDLNPNHIGISVLEFKKTNNIGIVSNNNYNSESFKIIKTISYDISKLTNKKGNHNKLKHETIEITNKIINICNQYQIKYIAVEDLNIESKNNNKGKNNNSLLNNKWLRSLFQQQLEKRAKLNNINFYKILPYYTSYIGNIMYNYFDPINASIEIGRRAYECFVLKNKQFYPKFEIKTELRYQWKEYLNTVLEWKELFTIIKNFKLRYRVSLEDSKYLYNVLRMSTTKSGVLLYDFV